MGHEKLIDIISNSMIKGNEFNDKNELLIKYKNINELNSDLKDIILDNQIPLIVGNEKKIEYICARTSHRKIFTDIWTDTINSLNEIYEQNSEVIVNSAIKFTRYNKREDLDGKSFFDIYIVEKNYQVNFKFKGHLNDDKIRYVNGLFVTDSNVLRSSMKKLLRI